MNFRLLILVSLNLQKDVRIYEQQAIDISSNYDKVRLVIEKHCRGCGNIIDLKDELCNECRKKSTRNH